MSPLDVVFVSIFIHSIVLFLILLPSTHRRPGRLVAAVSSTCRPSPQDYQFFLVFFFDPFPARNVCCFKLLCCFFFFLPSLFRLTSPRDGHVSGGLAHQPQDHPDPRRHGEHRSRNVFRLFVFALICIGLIGSKRGIWALGNTQESFCLGLHLINAKTFRTFVLGYLVSWLFSVRLIIYAVCWHCRLQRPHLCFLPVGVRLCLNVLSVDHVLHVRRPAVLQLRYEKSELLDG